jgi:hypothetical protein
VNGSPTSPSATVRSNRRARRNRQEGRLRIGDRVFDTVSWKGPKQSTEMLEEVPFSGILGDDQQLLQLSGRPD